MPSLFYLISIMSLTIFWDTPNGQGAATPFHKKQFNGLQLYEKHGTASTSFLENIAQKFPADTTISQRMDVDDLMNKYDASSDSVKAELARTISKPAKSPQLSSGTFIDSLSTDSAYASQTLGHEDGQLMSIARYMSDPDLDGSYGGDLTIHLIDSGIHILISNVVHYTPDNGMAQILSVGHHAPGGIRVSGLTYHDEHLGPLSIIAGPGRIVTGPVDAEGEENKIVVDMGPYQFEKVYDHQTACHFYQMCTISGCQILD